MDKNILNAIKHTKKLILNIKKQVNELYPYIGNFNDILNEFDILKNEIPNIEKGHINPTKIKEIKRLIELSEIIKKVLIKSGSTEFNTIKKTCNYFYQMYESLDFDKLILNDDDEKLLNNINLICNFRENEDDLFKINFYPISLATLEGSEYFKNNVENHKEALNWLKELPELEGLIDPTKLNKVSDKIFSDITLTKEFLQNNYKTKNARVMQLILAEKMNQYKNLIYKNSYDLEIFKETLSNIFKNCRQVGVNSVEGSVFICGLNEINAFILKANKPQTKDSQGVFHEFIIGSCLNQLRKITPGFMFVYGAFFCSPFEDSIEDLCSIDFNKAALTTIMISEYIPGKELKEYANSDDLDNILEQIFLTLKIAYKKYSFCHNDLHSGNIIIRELQELTIIDYNGIKIETKFIPQIIDYGKSLLMIKNESYLDYLKPFIIDFDKPKVSIKNSKIDNDQLITIENYNNIGIVHPSYDWLRLLISLSTYMKNTNKLYKYIIPYLELDYKENDLILIWFEQIKQNKKCNSFVPKKEFDTAYYKNIFN